MRRLSPYLVMLIALGLGSAEASAVDCSKISKQPPDYNAPTGLTVRTTSTTVVDYPAGAGTWHMRSCHLIVNPPLSAAGTQAFDVDWTAATISVSEFGLGNGPAPTTCEVFASVGRIGTTSLSGGTNTSECCFLAEISTGGCLASDVSCTCDDPGDLIVDTTILPSSTFNANLPGSSAGKCGLLGIEVFAALGLARWLRKRRSRPT